MLRFFLFFSALLVAPAFASEAPPPPPGADFPGWQRVTVSPMKTSIYVGRVRLTTREFARVDALFSTTYEAKVSPWFFWSEHGEITIRVPAADLARLAAGERIEFTGDAKNHRGKPRHVSGHATPGSPDGASGRIKVRIHVDDVTLVFDGDYQAHAR